MEAHGFGRKLTLPSNELVRQSRCKHVYRGGFALPEKETWIPIEFMNPYNSRYDQADSYTSEI